MLSLRKGLLAAAAGVVMAAGVASNANALPFDFNLANGVAAGTDLHVVNIDTLGFQQNGTTQIFQQISGGSASNQPFTDQGELALQTFTDATTHNSHVIPTFRNITLDYSLSGHENAGGFLVFDAGGIVTMKLDGTTVATFEVVPPSTSTTKFDVNNLTTATLSLGLNLVQAGPPVNLITDLLGNSLEGISIDIVTAQPQFLAKDVNPATCPVGAPFTLTTCELLTPNAIPGTVGVIASVPEPGTLALIGASLFGLASIRRRKAHAA